MRSASKDWLVTRGVRVVLVEVRTDSPAAVGMAQRRGSGKIRHLEAECVCVHEVHSEVARPTN